MGSGRKKGGDKEEDHGEVLRGPRQPTWHCLSCNRRDNWQCRTKCRCGRMAPDSVLQAAREADRAERAAGGPQAAQARRASTGASAGRGHSASAAARQGGGGAADAMEGVLARRVEDLAKGLARLEQAASAWFGTKAPVPAGGAGPPQDVQQGEQRQPSEIKPQPSECAGASAEAEEDPGPSVDALEKVLSAMELAYKPGSKQAVEAKEALLQARARRDSAKPHGLQLAKVESNIAKKEKAVAGGQAAVEELEKELAAIQVKLQSAKVSLERQQAQLGELQLQRVRIAADAARSCTGKAVAAPLRTARWADEDVSMDGDAEQLDIQRMVAGLQAVISAAVAAPAAASQAEASASPERPGWVWTPQVQEQVQGCVADFATSFAKAQSRRRRAAPYPAALQADKADDEDEQECL